MMGKGAERKDVTEPHFSGLFDTRKAGNISALARASLEPAQLTLVM